MASCREQGMMVTLGPWSEAGDVRRIEVRCQGGSWELVERLEGPLARFCFDVSPYEQRVTFDGGREAARALRCAADGIGEALVRDLGDGSYFLADLMDLLDAARVPYLFSARGGEELVFRGTCRDMKEAPCGASKMRWCGVQDSNL